MNLFWLFLKFTPVLLFIGGPITLITTYSIALAVGHVVPLFPYVSDTGAKPPESCIFGFLLSTSSFLIILVGYARYLEVQELLQLNPSIKIKPVWNRLAFASTVISSIGLNLVATFQEINEFTTHLTGAVMCFFCGTSYFVIQTVFTCRLDPEAKALFYIRVAITTLNIFCLVGMFIPVHWALSEFKGDDLLLWSEKDGGYTFHLVSTFFEWIMILTYITFLYTLFWDFRKFDLEPPAVKFKKLNNPVRESEDKTRRNVSMV